MLHNNSLQDQFLLLTTNPKNSVSRALRGCPFPQETQLCVCLAMNIQGATLAVVLGTITGGSSA